VEHGHDRKNRIVAAEVQLVWERDGERVQSDRPVRIKDPFGAAGSSRGVAHGRCIVFRQIDLIRLAGRFRQKILIWFASLREPAAAVIDYEDAFEMDSRPDLLEEVEQHILHNQKPVLGVIDDVSEFVRMQPQVKGVQHSSGEGNAEIGFQVFMPVPHEGRDAISFGHTRTFKSSR
jgi:hypothetical protein